MKPFDLEKALNGHPVVTRDGRKVTEIHYFKTVGRHYKLYGAVNEPEYGDSVHSWTDQGIFQKGKESHLDLFLESVQKTVYINVFRTLDHPRLYSGVHETEESARAACSLVQCVAVAVPVTFEE